MTIPEVWLNKFSFFNPDMIGEWCRVSPWLLRDILLKSHLVPEQFANDLAGRSDEPNPYPRPELFGCGRILKSDRSPPTMVDQQPIEGFHIQLGAMYDY